MKSLSLQSNVWYCRCIAEKPRIGKPIARRILMRFPLLLVGPPFSSRMRCKYELYMNSLSTTRTGMPSSGPSILTIGGITWSILVRLWLSVRSLILSSSCQSTVTLMFNLSISFMPLFILEKMTLAQSCSCAVMSSFKFPGGPFAMLLGMMIPVWKGGVAFVLTTILM